MKRYVYKATISDKRKSFIITRKEITNENDYCSNVCDRDKELNLYRNYD